MPYRNIPPILIAALTLILLFFVDESLSQSEALDEVGVPEYEILESFCWSIAVWNTARAGTGDLTENGNMYWYDIGESMLYDQGLVISYADDLNKTFSSSYNGSDSGVALIPMTSLTVTETSTYKEASSQWATPDTVIKGEVNYYVPSHPDTCVLIQRIEVCNNADTTVRIHLGEGIDWDIPDGSGDVNNRSGVDETRQELYQFGPVGSATEDYAAGAAIGCFLYGPKKPTSYVNAAAVLENDTWVDPNNGYDPAEIGELMATHSGFTASDPDSVENLSSFYIFARDLKLEPGECYKTCVVMTSRLDGRYHLQEQIDKGAAWTADHGIDCGGGGQACIAGDADASIGVDIDDVVFEIAYIFLGGPPPIQDVCCGDTDESGGVDIDDVVYLIAYIFSGGPEPIPSCR